MNRWSLTSGNTPTDTLSMDDVALLAVVRDSEPWVIVAYLVFLLLTSAVQGRNRRSRQNGATGRHARRDQPTAETETDLAKDAEPV